MMKHLTIASITITACLILANGIYSFKAPPADMSRTVFRFAPESIDGIRPNAVRVEVQVADTRIKPPPDDDLTGERTPEHNPQERAYHVFEIDLTNARSSAGFGPNHANSARSSLNSANMITFVPVPAGTHISMRYQTIYYEHGKRKHSLWSAWTHKEIHTK